MDEVFKTKETYNILNKKLLSLDNEILTLEESINNNTHYTMKVCKKYNCLENYKPTLIINTFIEQAKLKKINPERKRILFSIRQVKLSLNKSKGIQQEDYNFSQLIEQAREVDFISIIPDMSHSKQLGNRLTIKCPFHEEKTPSCSINLDKNLFYCFGCGEGGDIIHFVQKNNNLDFKSAIKFLNEH